MNKLNQNQINHINNYNDEYLAMINFFIGNMIDQLSKKNKLFINHVFGRIKKVAKEDSISIMELSGSYLFNYKDKIIDKDDEYFVAREYNLEVQNICKKYKIKYNDGLLLVDIIKSCYVNADENNKITIIKHVQKLLEIHIKYKLS